MASVALLEAAIKVEDVYGYKSGFADLIAIYEAVDWRVLVMPKAKF